MAICQANWMRSAESKLPKAAYADETFSPPTGPLGCPLVSLSSTYSFCLALGRVSVKEFCKIINITVIYAFRINKIQCTWNYIHLTKYIELKWLCKYRITGIIKVNDTEVAHPHLISIIVTKCMSLPFDSYPIYGVHISLNDPSMENT